MALALLGATPTQAQIHFELRTRLVPGWGAAAAPNDGPIVISRPGRYDFEVQEGVYNARGFRNLGVANWIGRIRSSEGGLSQPESPRPAPFDNRIGRDGVVADDATMIGNDEGYIDATVGPLEYAYTQPPPPPPPPAHGDSEYVPLYRFSLTIDDLTPREISISAESLLVAYTPITDWHVVTNIIPDPEAGELGYIEYVPIILPAQYGQHVPVAAIVINVVPAPGAAGAGVAAMACVFRRRRVRTRR
jgi:hypothetical protein